MREPKENADQGSSYARNPYWLAICKRRRTQSVQQRHRGPRPEKATTSGKQGDILWGSERNSRIRCRQASNRVFRQDFHNFFQDAVEGPATAETKEETTSKLRARDIGTHAVLGNMDPHQTKDEISM
jgi:hypothetical protein